MSPGYAGYKLCYYEVMKVIKGIVHQPFEVKGSSVFYAFSYYYDRAVESGLIGACPAPLVLISVRAGIPMTGLRVVHRSQPRWYRGSPGH